MKKSLLPCLNKARLSACVLICFAATLHAQSVGSSVANPSTWETVKTAASDRTQKLLSLSKSEGGSVSLYTSIAEKDLKIILDPFEKNTASKLSLGEPVETR